MKLYLDEKGAALPLVLMILFVLTLLGATIFMFNMAETKQVFKTEESMKAHYVARSGAHAVAGYIVDNPLSAEALRDSGKYEGYEFGEGEFDVLVYYDALDEVHVKSTGRVGDSEQSVIVTLTDRDIDFPLYGNDIEVKGASGQGSGKITGGDVYYGDNISFEDDYQTVLDEGRELVNEKFEFQEVIPPCEDEKLGIFYNLCSDVGLQKDIADKKEEDRDVIIYLNKKESIRQHDAYVITEHGVFGDISLQQGNTPNYLKIEPESNDDLLFKANSIVLSERLTVTLDNNTVAIVVEDSFEGNNAEIHLWGNGRLMLYVKDFEGAGNFKYVPDPDSEIIVNVFVSTNGNFDLSGTSNFTGAIYAPHADSVIGGNSTLRGWLIANNFSATGNFEINYVPTEMAGTSMDFVNYRINNWRYDE